MNATRTIATVAAAGLLLAGWAGADPVDPKLVVPHLKRPLVAAHLAPTEKRIQVAGNLKVTQVTGAIDLTPGRGRAVIAHDVINRSGEDLEVHARMAEVAPKRVTLEADGGSTVRFDSRVPVTRGKKHLRSVTVAPQLIVDDSFLLEPVDDFAIKVVLPDDAKKVIKSNKRLTAAEKTGGRLSYQWQGRGEYLTPLVLWWTTSDTDLSIDKAVRPDWENGTVAVALTIRNNGMAPARSVLLKEDFPTQIYTAGSASRGGFSLYKGEVNDTRLLWEYTVPELGAGEELSVDYTLRIDQRLRVAGLHETRALQDGEPVALSEPVMFRRPAQ